MAVFVGDFVIESTTKENFVIESITKFCDRIGLQCEKCPDGVKIYHIFVSVYEYNSVVKTVVNRNAFIR